MVEAAKRAEFPIYGSWFHVHHVNQINHPLSHDALIHRSPLYAFIKTFKERFKLFQVVSVVRDRKVWFVTLCAEIFQEIIYQHKSVLLFSPTKLVIFPECTKFVR